MALPLAQPAPEQSPTPDPRGDMYDLYLENTRDAIIKQLSKAGAPVDAKARKADLVAQLYGVKNAASGLMKAAGEIGSTKLGRAADVLGAAGVASQALGATDEDSPAPLRALGGALWEASKYAPTVGYAKTGYDLINSYNPTDEDLADAEYWQDGVAEMKLRDALAAQQAQPPPPKQVVDPLQTRLRDAILNLGR